MKPLPVLLLPVCCWFAACKQDAATGQMQTANAFINAFYSFNPDSLSQVLKHAPAAAGRMLYYQQWAKCGHYKVLDRSGAFLKNDSTIAYPVTVEDDLMKALQIDLHVTDTFHLTFQNGSLTEVTNTSNDPQEFYDAKAWMDSTMPDLTAKACNRPGSDAEASACNCIEAVVKGLKAFKTGQQQRPKQ